MGAKVLRPFAPPPSDFFEDLEAAHEDEPAVGTGDAPRHVTVLVEAGDVVRVDEPLPGMLGLGTLGGLAFREKAPKFITLDFGSLARPIGIDGGEELFENRFVHKSSLRDF